MSGKTPQRKLDYAGAIERLRRGLGMTQEALAEASGISPSYLSEVERGQKRPSTDVMVKIADALGISPSELLAYVERIDVALEMLERAHPSRGRVASPSVRRAWRTRQAGWVAREEGAEGARHDSPGPGDSMTEPRATSHADFAIMPSPAVPEETDTELREVELESRDQALGILMALANKLEEEDLKVLISLARRMGRAGR